MRRWARVLLILVSVVTVVVAAPEAQASPSGASAPTSAGESSGYFTDVTPPPGVPSGVQALWERWVTIDVAGLRDDIARIQDTDEPLVLELAGDVSVQMPTVELRAREDGFDWVGRGSDASGEPVEGFLSVTHDKVGFDPASATVHGEFWIGSRHLVIQPVTGSVHVIAEEVPDLPRPGDAGVEPVVPAPGVDDVLGPPVGIESHATVPWNGFVDVLAVWTPAAAASVPDMAAEVNAQIAYANTANAGSALAFRFRVVQSQQIAFTETANIGNDRLALQDPGDGRGDAVHDLRASFGADLVVLFGSGASWGPCGVAPIMNTVDHSFAASAFAVVDVNAPRGCGDDAGTHEMGHMMSLRHAWGDVDAGSNQPEAGIGSPFRDNHGFRNTGGDFHTVMAYPNDPQCPGGLCTPVAHWSDPDHPWNGWVAGVRDNGINTPADNARVLEITDEVVGTFLSVPSPIGALDSVSVGPGGGRVSGWAIDPDVTGAIEVHVYVDGVGAAITQADQFRGDIGAAYPAYGPNHGYVTLASAAGGSRDFCAYGINVGPGGNSLLGCRLYDVPVNPVGVIDVVSRAPGGARVSGWAIDPDTAAAIDVHFYVDGVGAAVGTANQTRTDIGAAYPGFGNEHGFSLIVPMTSGVSHQVCVYGINVDEGGNVLLECETFVTNPHPIGYLDVIARAPGGIRASGWAIDPDTANPIDVHVYLDGVFRASGTANSYRADVAAAYPDYGGDHGYNLYVSGVSAGTHQVCSYGLNVGVGGNALLGCQNVTVTVDPVGVFVTAVRTGALIQVTGWALDPDTASPIQVRITTALTTSTVSADKTRSDLGSWATYYGTNHGFDATVAASFPTDTICVTALNTGGGSNLSLGCRTL